jgi:hypothetical protein
MPAFWSSTGRWQSQWDAITGTAHRHTTWLVYFCMRPSNNPEQSHLCTISGCLYGWLLCMFQQRYEGKWITEPLLVYFLGTVYLLCSTSCMIHWARRLTASDMMYSAKGTQLPSTDCYRRSDLERALQYRHHPWTLGHQEIIWHLTGNRVTANRRWTFQMWNRVAIGRPFTTASSKDKDKVPRIGWHWDISSTSIQAAGRM